MLVGVASRKSIPNRRLPPYETCRESSAPREESAASEDGHHRDRGPDFNKRTFAYLLALFLSRNELYTFKRSAIRLVA
jgi:hypothetical protein